MKPFSIIVCIAIIAFACNQPSSSTEVKTHKPVTDIVYENVKGSVQQIVTETYLTDSASGKIGKLESRDTETYDDNGNALSYSNFTVKDSTTLISKYERDANGYLKSVATTKNGKPVSSVKLEVDSLGKYTLATEFDSTGKAGTYYKEITSNDFGEITGAKGYHPDSTLKFTVTSSYDSVYSTGGDSKDSVGKTTYSSVIKLNDKKDPAEIEEINVTKDSTTKTITTYTYDKWDDKANWIQQTKSEKGKPNKILIRIITYKQ